MLKPVRSALASILLVATCVTPAQADAGSGSEEAAGRPVAQTQSGELAGKTGAGVDAFLGIPYAAPPVGPNRWRAPQPPIGWDGVRDASTYGADCMQDKANNPPPPGHAVPDSEDCLFLNVWRPAGEREAPLPVMVWIHGGAFIMGAGSFSMYDGSNLARQGVIVVTLNYRLGRFGLFAVPELEAEAGPEGSANYYLMDQIQALKWVRDNIAAFGGDPENVTIFGESAGAVSVNQLMAVPQAWPYFSKAIAESGPPRTALVPLDKAMERDVAWGEGKGVKNGDLAALRALSAETVNDAPITVGRDPIQDGVLLKRASDAAFAAGEVNKVPYIAGANSWEENLLRWIPGALESYGASLGPIREELLAMFAKPGDDEETTLARIWGDARMVEPTRRTARLAAATGKPVWLYHYGYVPEALRDKYPGAGHDHEMQMVFATPRAESAPGWTANDQKVADTMSGYWVSFARTGNPNHAGAPTWPQLRLASDGDWLMHFAKSGIAAKQDFEKPQMDRLEELSHSERAVNSLSDQK